MLIDSMKKQTKHNPSDYDKVFVLTKKDDYLSPINPRNFSYYVDGREGNDALFIDGSAGGVVLGRKGSDLINARNVTGKVKIYGGDGGDDITIFCTKNSKGFAYGEDGNDTLRGGKKDDNLDGGGGKDKLFGESGDDQLWGGSKDDKVNGGDGNDILYGQNGDDVLKGGKGKDYFKPGSGDDTMTGGKGRDVFELSGGRDIVTDFDFASGEIIRLNKSQYGRDLRITQQGDDVRIRGDEEIDTLLKNISLSEFLEADVIDIF